jgi:hypothetical protein
MSEAHTEGYPGDELDRAPGRTGVVAVDRVIEAVEGLDATDVAEHPAVFERAHEELRRALDGPS